LIAEAVPAAEPGWAGVAAAADRDRIDRLSQAWTEALAAGRKAGFGRQIEGEGALLDPAAALPRAAPAPGAYQCRMVRLGRSGGKGPAFAAFKPFFCHVGVNDDQLSIVKQTGSARPGGYLWETESSARLIFLGADAAGDAELPLAYGESADHDVVGVFERVDEYRYRLAMPYPRGGALLEVLELIVYAPLEP
jgi:hypothetical protein